LSVFARLPDEEPRPARAIATVARAIARVDRIGTATRGVVIDTVDDAIVGALRAGAAPLSNRPRQIRHRDARSPDGLLERRVEESDLLGFVNP
tara:strand:- start:4177 stop:4455 length:279 start_codon:yes stop_codon:yes gene_type:complete